MKRIKLTFAMTALIVSNIALADPAINPWVQCGTISSITPENCQISSRPLTQYEYGIIYNSSEPHPVVCTFWNKGIRIANKMPYLVASDNPSSGMGYGGFVFYKGTDAIDDSECSSNGSYRHQYWQLTTDGTARTIGGNGCNKAQPVFCRKR